jgi:hypothetical protein
MRNVLGLVPVPVFAAIALFAAFPPGAVAPAAAKMTLNQCIANEQRCRNSCIDFDSPIVDPKWNNCLNRCEANHAACVDFAMDFADQRGIPTEKPPRATVGTVGPKPGHLDPHPGFSPHVPATTGAPLCGGAAPPLR